MTASLLTRVSTWGMVGLCLVLPLACQKLPTPPLWQWERVEAGLPRQAITLSVAANPLESKQLWAGYYDSGGLASSLDGGQSWTGGRVGLADNPVFDLLPIVNRDKTGLILWAATRDGLWQSLDAGVNWQPAPGNIPRITAFALATDATGRLYVGLDGAGIYAEIEPNRGWQRLTRAGPLESASVFSLAVSADGQQLYAGTPGQGIFASGDGGESWIATYSGEYAPNVALDPNQPDIAVASLRDRLVRTRDGGQSWHTLPLSWAGDEIFALLWLADGTLGAGTGQGRLYRSRDGGDSWLESGARLAPAGAVLALSPLGYPSGSSAQQLLAGTWSGVFRSNDGGQSWTYRTPTLGTPNGQTLLAAGERLLLGTHSALFQWLPDRQQWAPLPDQPPSGVSALAVDPIDHQVLYAGTSNRGVYRSQDGGASWEPLPALVTGIPALAVDPKDRDHIYLLAAWERVYESRDGGRSWAARWDGLGQVIETTTLVVDPLEPLTYVGTETGLFRREGINDDWLPVATELAEQSILALMVQAVSEVQGINSILYIGTTRGAYRSLDGGLTLEGNSRLWGQGLENRSVTAFLAEDRYPLRLYAGTAYAGIYESVDGGRSWYAIGPAGLGDDIIKAMDWGPKGELFVAAANSIWRGRRVD